MSEIDVQRLKNDPAYWDEVAPEGATHYYEQRTAHFKWFKMDDGVLYHHCPNDGWEPSLRNSQSNPAGDLIPRPTQWRGPEDGLPPVGTVCEVWRRKERVECEIVAHVQSDGVTEAVYQCATDWGWSSTSFRPLKSDKERAIDAAVAATILKDGPRLRFALSDIYDAGLLRLPEERS